LRASQWPLKLAFDMAMSAILAYFFLGALLVETVPKDIAALSLALLILLITLFVKQSGKPFNIIEKASAYVAAILVISIR
jgi:hypothetical protein